MVADMPCDVCGSFKHADHPYCSYCGLHSVTLSIPSVPTAAATSIRITPLIIRAVLTAAVTSMRITLDAVTAGTTTTRFIHAVPSVAATSIRTHEEGYLKDSETDIGICTGRAFVCSQQG